MVGGWQNKKHWQQNAASPSKMLLHLKKKKAFMMFHSAALPSALSCLTSPPHFKPANTLLGNLLSRSRGQYSLNPSQARLVLMGGPIFIVWVVTQRYFISLKESSGLHGNKAQCLPLSFKMRKWMRTQHCHLSVLFLVNVALKWWSDNPQVWMSLQMSSVSLFIYSFNT